MAEILIAVRSYLIKIQCNYPFFTGDQVSGPVFGFVKHCGKCSDRCAELENESSEDVRNKTHRYPPIDETTEFGQQDCDDFNVNLRGRSAKSKKRL